MHEFRTHEQVKASLTKLNRQDPIRDHERTILNQIARTGGFDTLAIHRELRKNPFYARHVNDNLKDVVRHLRDNARIAVGNDIWEDESVTQSLEELVRQYGRELRRAAAKERKKKVVPLELGRQKGDADSRLRDRSAPTKGELLKLRVAALADYFVRQQAQRLFDIHLIPIKRTEQENAFVVKGIQAFLKEHEGRAKLLRMR